jgi:hypothetical protein
MLNPILAALIHVTSEMAFILNSARLVRVADLAGPLSARRGITAQFGAKQNFDSVMEKK